MILEPGVVYWLSKISSHSEECYRERGDDLNDFLSAVTTIRDNLHNLYAQYIVEGLAEVSIERNGADCYIIETSLTDKGKKGYKAIKNGFSWDTETEQIDVEGTIVRLMGNLNSGITTAGYAQVAALKGPEYSTLRNAYLKHRMIATREGNRWYVKTEKPDSN